MVRTGLKEELRKPGEVPRVDAKWLSAHLGSALVIYSTLLYTAMDILRKVLIRAARSFESFFIPIAQG